MIKAKEIHKIYETKSGNVVALKNVSFDLPEQGFVFLLGKSGSGKSTLLNILGGLDKATSGEVIVNKRTLNTYSEGDLDDYRNRRIGFIFQNFNLIDEYNVYENIALTLHLRGEKNVKEKVSQALETVGLANYEKRKTSELSGGQKQRIAVARCLVGDTELMLADEPTGNLDKANTKEIFELLKEISKTRLVMAVTHDNENAKLYGDRIITLSDGEVESDISNISESNLNCDIVSKSGNESGGVKNMEVEYKPSLDVNELVSTKLNNKAKQIEKLNKSKKVYNKSFYDVNREKVKGINLACLTKLSFKNIWKKKYKLLVTILLFFFVLTVFGISVSALRYDDVTVSLNAFYESGINEFKVGVLPSDDNNHKRYLTFTDEEIMDLESKFPDYKFNKMMRTYKGIIPDDGIEQMYYLNSIGVINEDVMKQYGFETLWGGLPKHYNEVCLSKHIADEIIAKGLYKGVEKYEDFENYALKSEIYPDFDFKVVGVIDTKINVLIDRLLTLSDGEYSSPISLQLEGSYSSALMVTDEFMEKIYLNGTQTALVTSYDKYHPTLSPQESEPISQKITLRPVQESYAKSFDFFGKVEYCGGRTALAGNEIAVSYSIIKDKAREMFPKVNPNTGISDEQIFAYLNSENAYLRNVHDAINSDIADYKIVGFYRSNKIDNVILMNNTIPKKLNLLSDTAILNTNLKGDKKQDAKLVEEFLKDSYNRLVHCTFDVDTANWQAELLRNYGLYASLAFGVFVIVMMSHLILTSINTNKKQIGVLRALGMRSSGVAYIFLLESLIVGILAFCLSVIAIFPVSFMMTTFASWHSMKVKVIIITAVEIFSMLALSLIITVIASILPIYKKSRAQPINLLNE